MGIQINQWKIKVIERTKGRMKLQIKLDQEQAEAFKEFCDQVKPQHISQDEFIKGLFISGIQATQTKLEESIKQHMEDNREQYETSGFTFDDEGKLVGHKDENAVEVIDGEED